MSKPLERRIKELEAPRKAPGSLEDFIDEQLRAEDEVQDKLLSKDEEDAELERLMEESVPRLGKFVHAFACLGDEKLVKKEKDNR